MNKIDELNVKADTIADELLEFSVDSISVENARLLIRVVFKEGYMLRAKENLRSAMLDNVNGVPV